MFECSRVTMTSMNVANDNHFQHKLLTHIILRAARNRDNLFLGMIHFSTDKTQNFNHSFSFRDACGNKKFLFTSSEVNKLITCKSCTIKGSSCMILNCSSETAAPGVITLVSTK